MSLNTCLCILIYLKNYLLNITILPFWIVFIFTYPAGRWKLFAEKCLQMAMGLWLIILQNFSESCDPMILPNIIRRTLFCPAKSPPVTVMELIRHFLD